MTQSDDSASAPKIIVDSDWKEQVAKEKELAAKEASSTQSPSSESPGSESPSSESTDSQSPDSDSPSSAEPPQVDREVTAAAVDASASVTADAAASTSAAASLPEPSFEVLVSMLFTQAIASLGQMPGLDGSPPQVDKPMAKHLIDTLEILETKTKGNLSDDESKMMREALHALRMTYVGVRG